jgi:FtsP/CotA-like multicopper oxidase with cupredoxin domain
VNFRVIRRHELIFDSQATTTRETPVVEETPPLCAPNRLGVDGICLTEKNITTHDGAIGKGYRAHFPKDRALAYKAEEFKVGDDFMSEQTKLKDVVAAWPGQVTVIQAEFTKPGRYVWHCHILSHEDHEMMRRFEVS